jgi:ribosome biogenesis GTPase A
VLHYRNSSAYVATRIDTIYLYNYCINLTHYSVVVFMAMAKILLGTAKKLARGVVRWPCCFPKVVLQSCPRRGLASDTTTNNSSNNDKVDDHIGRHLSKPPVWDPKVLASYQEKVKSFAPISWTLPREALLIRAEYEHRALENIHARSYESKVLIEIRDARLPATCHHPSFTRLARYRTHLICYTHADLLDARTRDKILKWTYQSFPDASCQFVDANQTRGDKEAFIQLLMWIADAVDEAGGMNCALTVGLPNTGKSSVLQALLRTSKHLEWIPKQTRALPVIRSLKVNKQRPKRNPKKVAPPDIQDKPGKTRVLTEYLLRSKPKLYFLDVPGVTHPHFYFDERPESWYGMGAANLLLLNNDQQQNPDLFRGFCDYVLHCANRDHVFDYVDKLKLDNGPTDDIDEALSKLGNKYKDRLSVEDLLLKRSQTFLKLYNTGNLGPILMDDVTKPFERFIFKDSHFDKRERDEDYGENFHDEDYNGLDEFDEPSSDVYGGNKRKGTGRR